MDNYKDSCDTKNSRSFGMDFSSGNRTEGILTYFD